MSSFDSDYCCLCSFISFFSIFLWNYIFHCVLVANTLYWHNGGGMAPWKSAEFKPVFASFILLLNPSKTLRNPSFTHLGHMLPLAQGASFISHWEHRNTAPIESLDTSKLAGGNKKTKREEKTQEVLLPSEHDCMIYWHNKWGWCPSMLWS